VQPDDSETVAKRKRQRQNFRLQLHPSNDKFDPVWQSLSGSTWCKCVKFLRAACVVSLEAASLAALFLGGGGIWLG
jgi:hypothetical protein